MPAALPSHAYFDRSIGAISITNADTNIIADNYRIEVSFSYKNCYAALQKTAH